MNEISKKPYRILFILAFWLAITGCQDGTGSDAVTPPAVAATPVTAATPTSATIPETPTAVATMAPSATTAAPPPTVMPTPSPLPATEPPPSPQAAAAVKTIRLVPIAGGLARPTYLTHAFDGRLFVVEQAGTIRIIENGQLLDQPFLDIIERVGSTANEQGLLSVAFHPDYAQNGRFFINYTNRDGDTVISRLQVSAADPNRADAGSETPLLTISQPYGNHNGGLVKFGPDGYLYVGMGDGGSGGDPQGNGQNAGTLLGTLLRLDVDFGESSAGYAIPATNPFVDDDAARNEIWAIGLRNPWRFSFDRETGDLYIADVGQNEWEELHFQPAGSAGGENYGWNILEGSHCFRSSDCDTAGLELPIFEYNHSQGGCSITGGYVYRGQQFPALYGNYFFADYCSGNVWRAIRQDDGSWDVDLVLERSGYTISSFGEDAAGELYVTDHSGNVLQIQP